MGRGRGCRYGMRRIAVVGCLFLLLSVGGLASGGATAARKGGCWPAGSKTLARSARARVFSEHVRYEGDYVYGCLLRTGRRYGLGVNYPDDESVSAIALRGPFTGYIHDFLYHDDPTHRNELVVRDLRSGAVVRSWARYTGDRGGYDNTVKRFALGPRGTLAWLVERWRDQHTTYRVYAWGSGQKPTLLDSGADSSSEIRLEHGCVHWASGGQPRAACPTGLH
jgi:hypothetical protein